MLYGGLTGKSKADFAEGDARFVSYVNIFNRLSTNVTPEDRVRVAEGERQNRVRYGDVLFTGSSESADEVGMASGVTSEPPEPLYLNSFCFGFRPHNVDDLDPEFAKHLFRSLGIRKQIIRTSNGVTRINISKERFRGIKIPIPPLAIQREIASILDKMDSLKAELESELEYRSRQYAFYHGSLLHSPSEFGGWPTVMLRDVTDVLVGFPFKSAAFTNDLGGTRLMRGDNIGQGFLKPQSFKLWRREPGDGLERYELADRDVVLAMDRPWIPAGLKWSTVRDLDLPSLLVQRVARLRGEPSVLNQDFLACLIGSPDFTRHVLNVQTGNTVPHISAAQIGDYRFELPPLSDQTRVAKVLNSFDALVNDLSVGLPAEIAARRQQYEHYRDRLLTFDEAVA